MKHYLILFLLFGGCANPHIVDSRDITIPNVKVNHNIPVYFDEVEYDEDLHNHIVLALDKLPQVHDWLIEVRVVDDLGDKAGVCNWFIHVIYIKYGKWSQIKRVLWHELCHALQCTNLTDVQLEKWRFIAKMRLKSIGLDNFVGEDWVELNNRGDLPTFYAAKNIWEFIADCFAKYMISKDYAMTYPFEYKLIIECGWGKR